MKLWQQTLKRENLNNGPKDFPTSGKRRSFYQLRWPIKPSSSDASDTQKSPKLPHSWGLSPVQIRLWGAAMADIDSKNSAKTWCRCRRGHGCQTHRTKLLFWLRTYLYPESFQTRTGTMLRTTAKTALVVEWEVWNTSTRASAIAAKTANSLSTPLAAGEPGKLVFDQITANIKSVFTCGSSTLALQRAANVPNTLNQAQSKSFVGYMETRLVLTLHLFFFSPQQTQQRCKHPPMGVWFHLCRKFYVRTTSVLMQSVNCRWETVWGCEAVVRLLKMVKNVRPAHFIIATERLSSPVRTCRVHMATTQPEWRWKHKSSLTFSNSVLS